MPPDVRPDGANIAGRGSILRQDVDFTKLLLNLLDSLDAIGVLFEHAGPSRPSSSHRLVRSQSGLMADSHQTTIASPEKSRSGPCSKSWSLPMDKSLSSRDVEEGSGPTQRLSRFNLTSQPYQGSRSSSCRAQTIKAR